MKYKKLLLILFFIAFALRVVFISNIPSGVLDDEAGIGFNAYSIARTGRDEWARVLPMQFRSFGDWKLPVYIYILSLFFKFAPLSIFWTRMPSALFGSATVVLFYYLALLLFEKNQNKEKIALFSSIILTFNPWHFGLSRIASEANLGLFFFVSALYFFIKDNKDNYGNKNNINLLFALTTSFICFNSYHTFRFLLPAVLFYLYFSKVYSSFSKKKKIRFFWTKEVTVFLFLLITFLAFNKKTILTRLFQINIFADQGIINNINEFRGLCLAKTPAFLCRLIFNKPAFWLKEYLFNYVSHLSPQFLFFPEFEKGYQILPHYSYFFFLDFVFLVIGLVIGAKNKNLKILYFILLASALPSSLTAKGHFARPAPLILPIVIFSSLGISWFIDFIIRKKRYLVFTVPIFVYFYLLLEFFISYFTSFPVKQARYTHYEYQPLFSYLNQVSGDYDNIYVSKVNHDAWQYIFYLFYSKIEPEDYFQADKDILVEDNGWVWVKKVGKYNFINQTEMVENYPPNSLLAIDPQGTKGLKEFSKAVKTISYPNGDIAFDVFDLDLIKKREFK